MLLAESARDLASTAESATDVGKAQRRAVAAIVMAVACVEAFLNAQARLLLHSGTEFPGRSDLKRDVADRRMLGHKLKNWPYLMYEKTIDYDEAPGKAFYAVVQLRNKLIHFNAPLESVEAEGVEIQGLLDTTVIDDIEPADAWNHVMAAEEFIAHLLRLAGTPPEEVPHALHHWLATTPPRAA